jgi:hypothetical protein
MMRARDHSTNMSRKHQYLRRAQLGAFSVGAAGLWSSLYATVPPTPEAKAATIAAASGPSTWRSRSRLKSTEVTLDQPCREQGFARVTQSEGEGAPDVPIAREIGRDSRGLGPDGHRPSCIAPKSDQDAR